MSDRIEFQGQSIDGAIFRNCAMSRSLFDDINLSDARYVNIDFRRASFRNVNMTDVSIDDANIKGLTISGHDIQALIAGYCTSAPTASGGRARAMTAEPQLFVADIDASCRFYIDKLGFRMAFSHGQPAFYAQIVRDRARLNLRRVSGPVFEGSFRQREADALSATLTVDDAQPIFDEFRAAGVDFHQPLKTEQWGALTFIVRDPDGNLIAFAGRPS